jgi:hypothetical protein
MHVNCLAQNPCFVGAGGGESLLLSQAVIIIAEWPLMTPSPDLVSSPLLVSQLPPLFLPSQTSVGIPGLMEVLVH